jgi:hypothetical protein
MDFPVNKIVDRAAFYGVSDFVEDMLCRESRSRRADAAKTLLGRICGPARFSSSQCPYPTRRILECLIKMGNLPPRIICDVKDAETSVQVPETMGLFVGGRDSLKINIYEVSRFIESQLTIVDSFLKAGADHWDPRGLTNSLAYFPRNFVLPKEAIQEAVEKEVDLSRKINEDDGFDMGTVGIELIFNELNWPSLRKLVLRVRMEL